MGACCIASFAPSCQGISWCRRKSWQRACIWNVSLQANHTLVNDKSAKMLLVKYLHQVQSLCFQTNSCKKALHFNQWRYKQAKTLWNLMYTCRNTFYYMTSRLSGQDEPNPMVTDWLPKGARWSGIACFVHPIKFSLRPSGFKKVFFHRIFSTKI